LNKFACKKLDAYERITDMNYNNEIFEISNIYIIGVTCCMYWCLRACVRAGVRACGRACMRARVHTEKRYINITCFQ